MTCYCYIVECSDGTFYTGWTLDPERRVAQHNKGVGAKYTSTRRPVKLVYLEEQPDRISAMKRELVIKRMKRAQKNKLTEEWNGK
ncbi:MAG: GIY-YIG nuclease family protein [Chloroflexi bacterium]|nr:GIY-YIG nuclease family protein [Chloroflexota bacterium]